MLAVPVDLVQLTEALPFLVITVGFDKPFRLARAVFGSSDITPIPAHAPSMIPDMTTETDIQSELRHSKSASAKPAETSTGAAETLDLMALDRGLARHARIQREISEAKNRAIRWAAPVAAKTLVSNAVQKVGPNIVQDYAIEVAMLTLGALSGIGGLSEFCYLGMFRLLPTATKLSSPIRSNFWNADTFNMLFK